MWCPACMYEIICRLYRIQNTEFIKEFQTYQFEFWSALCHMGVKLIAPNRRDLMVSLALHYKDIIVVQIFWLAMIICINLRPEMALIGLWWPWKIVGDSQISTDMLHFKYGWCSINHSWVRVWKIYYMVLKNVTQCNNTIIQTYFICTTFWSRKWIRQRNFVVRFHFGLQNVVWAFLAPKRRQNVTVAKTSSKRRGRWMQL